MAIDHYGKIVDPDVLLQTHAIGRLSFPLFATIIGIRLGLRPELASKYARRLLPWALISQPVYVLAGRFWYQGNILFTLLLGVALTALVRRWIHGPATAWRTASAAALVVFCSFFVEYGLIGVVIIAVTALLASRDPWLAVLASGPLGLAANLTYAVPPLEWVDLCALGSTIVAALSVSLSARLPRLPTHAFYAFYPLHLLALHLYDLYG
jgi:hypothetical protein